MRVALFVVLLAAFIAPDQDDKSAQRQSLDKEIAAQFAPVFYQGLGEYPRADYITNFDFDADWRGDNNWENLDDRSYPLRAYIYFSVVETATHYFVHYAIFHPRDYKGDLVKSAILGVLINEGVRQMGKDPTGGRAKDLALSHENDLEGCLVVAEKKGDHPSQAAVRYVETMAHNQYLRYCPGEERDGACESIEMKGRRPLIFIEAKGHGPSRYTGSQRQLKSSVNGVLIYSYMGRAEDHDQIKEKSIGYDLIPVYDTLWRRAQEADNETYGESHDYEKLAAIRILPNKPPEKIEIKFGSLGSAFRGEVGSRNKARPPWAWFDDTERDRPLGEWFFDPASVIAAHFNPGMGFSKYYVYHPYFKIGVHPRSDQ